MDNENKKETIGEKVKNRLKNSVNSYIQEKTYTLCGMGRELRLRADTESEEYLELKSKHDKLEARVKIIKSYLDGTYKAEKLAKDATKAKEKREATISGPKSKSKKLGEKLETLEFKREKKIQQIKNLAVRMNRVNLLAEDEVEQRAEEWKIKNEMIKHSLSLRKINARIGMTKLRKSNQDSKDVEKMRQAIDKYNEKITEYKKKIEKANEDRPKDIVEKFMREHDWVLGEVTIDREKRINEIIAETNEKNNKRREKQQRTYEVTVYAEEARGNYNLPYREMDENERNELIVYSEKMTTFKEMTEFIKTKVARAAGKTVGFAILAARKIKSMPKAALGKIRSIPQALEAKIEHSSAVEDTDMEESKPTNNIINLGKKKEQTELKPKKEKRTNGQELSTPLEKPKTFVEEVKSAMNKTVTRLEVDRRIDKEIQELQSSIEPSAEVQLSRAENNEVEETPTKRTPVKVTPVKKTLVEVTPAKGTRVKVTPVRKSVAVDNNVKKAVEMVGKNHGQNQSNPQSTKPNREEDFTWGEDSETK